MGLILGILFSPLVAVLLAFVSSPSKNRAPTFGKKDTVQFNDFSGGLNNKFSPLLLANNEVADIQNYNYDQKGTLLKRKGTTRHYPTAFGVGPVMGAYNYRKENGTSRIVAVSDGKIFYDKPQFNVLYNSQATWETAGTQRTLVDTTGLLGVAAGSIQHAPGQGGLGLFRLAARIGGFGGPQVLEQGIWQSNTIDISTVSDKTTGTIVVGSTVPTGATITIQTRVSPDGVTWDAWLALGGGNSIQSVGTRTNLQVRILFNSTSRRRASVQSLQVLFDQTPAMSVLVSGLSTTQRWSFETMNDIMWGVDGSDAPIKWDGTTQGNMGGSPPICLFIQLHKNYLFLAGNPASNRSRLYFSDLGLPESWPALNFIDVGKGDGDSITGLQVLNDQLVIYKDHSCWVLQGSSPTNFVLRKATTEAGCMHGHAAVVNRNSAGIWDRTGFYFFDGARVVLASEKIEKTILGGGTNVGLNQRQFQKAAAVFFKRKIYIALPEGGSSQLTNNVVLVFDTLRNAWTVYRGIHASEFVIWRQQNADTLLYGSADQGQLYDMEQAAYNDDGNAIDAYVVTKAVDFGSPILLSLVRRAIVSGDDPDGGTITGLMSFFTGLSSTESSTQTATFDRALSILAGYPGKSGIGPTHALQVKFRNNTLNQGMSIFSIAFEFVKKGVRVTGNTS